MDKKISIEVNKKNKNLLEWTKTLEIEYQTPKNVFSKEEQEILQEEINSKKQKIVKNEDEKTLNTITLSMEGNPFYQPSMNTFEFSIEDGQTIEVNFPNGKKKITDNDKSIILDKLYEEKIISLKTYTNQKKKVI